jgi:hypothetical protein
LESGGGGIRTLERPVTSNGFRDRPGTTDLQGFLFPFASGFANAGDDAKNAAHGAKERLVAVSDFSTATTSS